MYLGRIVESGAAAALFARAEPSVHEGAARRSRQGRAAEAHVRADQGRDPVAARPAVGLPFPSALPARDAALPRRRSGAARDRARADVRVPSQRRCVTMTSPYRRHAPGASAIPLCSIRRTAARTIPGISTTRRRAPRCGGPRTRTSRACTRARRGTVRRCSRRCFLARYIDPTAASPTSIRRSSPARGRVRSSTSRKTVQGIGLVWRVARNGEPMYARKLAPDEIRRRIDTLLSAVPRGARSRTRRCAPRVRRGLARRLPFDAGGRRRERRRSGARARRFRPRRSRRHDVRRRVHRRGRRRLAGARLRRRDQRSVQGCRDRPPARPTGGAPPQSADRGQPPALHGRVDARAATRAMRSSNATSIGWSPRSPRSCARACADRDPWRRLA